jgi:hypothetical protein
LFFQNWGKEILEIALGVSVANQGTAYILNRGRKTGDFSYFKFDNWE